MPKAPSLWPQPYLLYVRMRVHHRPCPGRNLVFGPIACPSFQHTPCAFLGQAEKAAAEKAAAEKAAAERAAVEKAAAEQAAAERAAAAALGLLQPLEALSLDANTLRTATAAAVAYCDSQGVTSFADLIERASRLIVHPQAAPSYCLESSWP